MATILQLLAMLGRHGAMLLVLAMLAGLALPPLAELARAALGPAVLALTFGAFLRVDLAAIRAELARRDVLLLVAWLILGVPLLGYGFVLLLEPEADLALGMMLMALAPPVGSAAAVAAMLGLDVALAMVASVAATLVTPFVAPTFATLLAGAELSLDPVALALRLAALVLGGALAAEAVRRLSGRYRAAVAEAGTGVCVLGLLVLAFSAVHGLPAMLAEDPFGVAWVMGLALGMNLAFQLSGSLVFRLAGRRRALTAGLVSGNRNVTLIWAAAAPALAGHPGAELYLAASSIAIFLLPVMVRLGLRLRPPERRSAQA